MSNLPYALIFINNALSPNELLKIQSQLYISETISFNEFNSRINIDENYLFEIKSQFLRILVLCDDLSDHTNRQFADIVIFVKQGLVSLLKNNFGPPNLTLSVERINIFDLLGGVNSNQVINISIKNNIYKNCGCESDIGLGGIEAIKSRDISGVTCANPDSLKNNEDFKNRSS